MFVSGDVCFGIGWASAHWPVWVNGCKYLCLVFVMTQHSGLQSVRRRSLLGSAAVATSQGSNGSSASSNANAKDDSGAVANSRADNGSTADSNADAKDSSGATAYAAADHGSTADSDAQAEDSSEAFTRVDADTESDAEVCAPFSLMHSFRCGSIRLLDAATERDECRGRLQIHH